jgi:hypothetical protein
MKALVLAILLMTISPAFGQELQPAWESSFKDAEQAFERRDYFGARRLFSQTLAEAERSSQELELAKKLESVAEQYAAKNRCHVAAALRKQAGKIYDHIFGLATRAR